MKKTFRGYYRLTEEEFSTLWDSCLFFLDANVLLNLYRYSQETSDELVSILRQVSDRIWVPHQAALEYQQQRLQVIAQQMRAYDDLKTLLEKTKKQLEDGLRSWSRHPQIDVGGLMKRIQRLFAAIERDLNKLKREHPDLLRHDGLRDTLSDLLEGKVGSPYSTARLTDIYRTGKTRYEQGTPPGYKDAVKEGTRQYGDLVLWFQVIDKAKETQKPVILVTDDRKDDWWLRFNGQTICPRPELVDEMHSEAGVLFHLYQADPFMEHARKFLEMGVEQKAIDEVRDVRRRDEEHLGFTEAAAPTFLSHAGTEYQAFLAALQGPARDYQQFLAALQGPTRDYQQFLAALQGPARDYQQFLAALQGPARDYQQFLAALQGPARDYQQFLAALQGPTRDYQQFLAALQGPTRDYQQFLAALRGPAEVYRAIKEWKSIYQRQEPESEDTENQNASGDSEDAPANGNNDPGEG